MGAGSAAGGGPGGPAGGVAGRGPGSPGRPDDPAARGGQLGQRRRPGHQAGGPGCGAGTGGGPDPGGGGSGHLEELALAGADALAQAGCGEPVTVSLEEDCWFPTRDYADFSLPAGRYTALRVVIGAGEGHNWWCVVFPPLCLGSVSQMADTGLSDRQVALITGADEGYQIQFKAVELWEQFRRPGRQKTRSKWRGGLHAVCRPGAGVPA